jgi:hypothetical protein
MLDGLSRANLQFSSCSVMTLYSEDNFGTLNFLITSGGLNEVVV